MSRYAPSMRWVESVIFWPIARRRRRLVWDMPEGIVLGVPSQAPVGVALMALACAVVRMALSVSLRCWTVSGRPGRP